MNKSKLPDYARYSSLGIQMALFVTLCAVGGHYLDKFKWTQFPLFTVLGSILGVFGAMYYMIRQLTNNK